MPVNPSMSAPLPLPPWACTNCGFWQRWFARPTTCPVCLDVRNELPPHGFELLSAAEVAGRLTCRWREAMPGVEEFLTEPRFGLDGHGWLLRHPEGNVAFEAAGWYSPEALDRIEALGGIAVLAASHAHAYGALWQLQERFDPPVVAIHTGDLGWTGAFRVTWPWDDRFEVRPGLTLVHTGGHFDGHAVLHDAGRRALFAGDALKVDAGPDGRAAAISCHKAYHQRIPLSHGEVRRYRDVLGALTFDSVFTPFEHVPGADTAAARHLFDTLLDGPPSVDPVEVPR